MRRGSMHRGISGNRIASVEDAARENQQLRAELRQLREQQGQLLTMQQVALMNALQAQGIAYATGTAHF